MFSLLSYSSRAARRPAAALFLSLFPWGALALLLLLGPAAAVRAATRTVTSTADSGTGSLRAVIAAAGAGDTLTFSVPAHSTIKLTTGALAISKSLSITGPSGGVAIDGGGQSGVFSVTGGTASSPVALTGLILQNGKVSAGYGGGVYNVGTATLTGCTITGSSSANYQGGHGGGVYNNGTITLTNCTLTGNSVTDTGSTGGGVYNDSSGTATLTGCILTGNTAPNYGDGGGVCNLNKAFLINCTLTSNSASMNGGAIFNYRVGTATEASCTITLTGCTLTKNSGSSIYNLGGTASLTDCTLTENSGGIFNYGVPSATLTLTGCTLTGNSAQKGGAIEALGGTATLTDCTLADNSASQRGGGIYNNGTVTLMGCTLTGNTAPEGGGVCNDRAALSLTDCILVQNSAQLGGAVYNNDSGLNQGFLSMTSCTLTQNSASESGGGVCNNEGAVTLTNDILYGDTSADSSTEISANSVSPSYCDIQGGYTGTGNLSADPAFVRTPGTNSAADLGDLHLKPGSPCFGKGAPSQAGTEDKDGVTRANPPTVGAYEGARASTQTQIALAAGSSATIPVGGSASFTVTVANAGSPGGPTPTGAVQLRVNGSPVGSPVALAGGPVTLTHTFPLVGTYTVSTAYTPDTISFTASASNSLTETVVGTPTANAQSVAVAFNTAKAVTLTGSDPNSPARALTYTVTSSPTHGTLSGTAPSLTYTPAAGYHGADSFTFKVSNGVSTGSPATVTLTVAAGVPAANAQAVPVAFNTAKAITLTGSDPDVPALPLTYTVVTGPTHGTLTGTAPSLTYTPTAGYTGPDSFTFTARNGVNTSAPATVSLTVNPVFLSALTFTTPVPGGTVEDGTVTLSGITPTDVVVGLSSSDPVTIRLFRSVLVPAGSSSATFTINTFRSHTDKTVTVQAVLGSVTLSKDLTITGR